MPDKVLHLGNTSDIARADDDSKLTMTIAEQATCAASDKLENGDCLRMCGLPKGEILLDDPVRVRVGKETLMWL